MGGIYERLYRGVGGSRGAVVKGYTKGEGWAIAKGYAAEGEEEEEEEEVEEVEWVAAVKGHGAEGTQLTEPLQLAYRLFADEAVDHGGGDVFSNSIWRHQTP